MSRPIVAAGISLAVLLTAVGVPPASADSLCFGTDAPPSSRPPSSRYEIENGEVHDTKTKLTWQRCSVGQHWAAELGCVGVIRQMSWREAMKLADAGWQLPTKEELSSLIAPECGSPAIDERAFPDMELTKLWYWTSSRDGALAWYIAFGGGSVRTGGPLDLNAVRLVRRGR